MNVQIYFGLYCNESIKCDLHGFKDDGDDIDLKV